MVKLPLTIRELTRIARSPRMYRLRAGVIGAAFLTLFIQWATARLEGRWHEVSPETIGQTMAVMAVVFQIIIVFVVLPMLSAPLLANERRYNSLSLLMLADFRGSDIFLAKFVSAFAEAEMLMLGTLPLMAFATFFGGISVADAVNVWAVLSICGMTICAIGLMCSSFARHPVNAMILTIFLVILVAMGSAWSQMYIWYKWRIFYKSNIYTSVLAVLNLEETVLDRWGGMLGILLLGVAATCATLLWLPHAATYGPRWRLFGPSKPYGATHRRLLQESPAAPFISAHSAGFVSTLQDGSTRRALALLFAVAALVPGVGATLVLLLLAYDVTLSISWMRRSGALDDLVLTPLGERRLAADICTFHVKRAAVYFPALAVLAAEIYLIHFAIQSEVAYVVAQRDSIVGMLPPGFRAPYELFMTFAFAGFALVQGPALVAVACAAGSAHTTGRGHAFRVGAALLLLYAAVIGVGTTGQWSILWFEPLRAALWLPGLVFGLAGFGLFGAAGVYGYRRFLNSLGPLAVSTDDLVPPREAVQATSA